MATIGAAATLQAPRTASASDSQQDGFPYPSIYHFPPFFTIQRNAQTLASQMTAWTRLVLDFCQFHKIFILDAEGEWQRTTGVQGLFHNARIQRQLDGQAIRQVFKALVDQGDAAWDPPMPTRNTNAKAMPYLGDRILVFWRKPEAWGQLIYDWITATGQNGSIMTFFELTEGDLVEGQEFYQLPQSVLRPALAALEKQGKARLFEGTEGGDGMAGVKFA